MVQVYLLLQRKITVFVDDLVKVTVLCGGTALAGFALKYRVHTLDKLVDTLFSDHFQVCRSCYNPCLQNGIEISAERLLFFIEKEINRVKCVNNL